MVQTNPLSGLSIRRTIDIYAIFILVAFAIFLFWLGFERCQDFRSEHQRAADKATQIAAREIKDIIASKQRTVQLFSEDHRDLILALSRQPDEPIPHTDLNDQIRRDIPDFFASNIMTPSGEIVVGDFDGFVGELCVIDMKQFISNGRQVVRVHPNIDTYHYDVLSRFPDGKENKLFFVSFNTSELANLLESVQPLLHELIIINKNMQDLIEITASGSRAAITDRDDYRFTEEEKQRVMSSAKVKGTMWHVVDLHNPGLLNQYRSSILKEYLIVYLVFGLIAFYMRSVLVKADYRRNKIDTKLRIRNEEIKILNEKLERLAITDGLTGLNNRRYIDEQLNVEWSRCQRTGHTINIVLIDIDYFKKYNDYYGHQAGDECLVVVANLMKTVFKRAGDIVARYGGEEFIVVMSDISSEDAEKILHHYQQQLEGVKLTHKPSFASDYVTVSAGLVSMVPTESDILADAIRKADSALYMAKAGGRNQIYVYMDEDKTNADQVLSGS